MARALSSRRRKAGDDWTDDGPADQRQTLSNAAARADTIRMAVREQSRMEAEIATLNADLREFKSVHIKGDLGFKNSDWNAIYRVSQLEVEDRDQLLDTLREGFAALGIGQTLDWVAAAEDEAPPNGAAAPSRRRKAKAPVNPRVDNPDAYEQGEADGAAGHRDHAARWPNGEIGAAAYELGHAAGARERYAAEPAAHVLDQHAGNPEPVVAPKRGRGRPRKESQPELSIVEGTGGDAAA